YCCDFAS
ncbi:hypothetical protein CP03DC29_1004B, partial [Chlamydia psittaci 03DC29]